MRSPTRFGQRRTDSDRDLRNEQPWDHAAVAIGEAPEIVVRAHLPAVYPVHLAHALLDEGMAGFRQHRRCRRWP